MPATIGTDEFIGNMSRHIKKEERIIANDVFQESVTSDCLTTVFNVKGEFQMASSRMESVIQPFQKLWTPKGKPHFEPVKIQVRRCKIDIELYPHEIMDLWKGFMFKEKLTPKEMPIAKYVMQEMIIPQIQEDRETILMYGGVYQAPTSGTAGATIDSFDGLEKVMNDHVTDGRIAPIPLGAITAGNAFEKLEEFHDNLPYKWQTRPLEVKMSHTIRKSAHRDRRADYGSNVNYAPSTQNDMIDFTSHKLKHLPSMAGKQRLWSTPKWNAVRLIDEIDPSKVMKLRVEEVDRKVKVFGDWNEGVGFLIPGLVFMSDGDLS